jgi:hypothetical protein
LPCGPVGPIGPRNLPGPIIPDGVKQTINVYEKDVDNIVADARIARINDNSLTVKVPGAIPNC